MLKSLRVKFVAIIMASVAVVLAIVFSGICIADYQRSMSDVERALSSSLDRASEGVYERRNIFFEGEFSSQSADSRSAAPGFAGMPEEEPDGQFSGPRIGGRGDGDRSLVPVGVYSLDGAGNLNIVSGYTTAFIDDDVIESVTSTVVASQDGIGEIGGYGLIYQKRTLEKITYVAFTDAAYASNWQSLAISLAISAIIVLAVFFVIALFLSKWALKPVEEAWTAQRQFVADASHELKTPLTVVLANTSILLKHPDRSIASQSQWIESTQVEAENMQGLVNEMLELAQVESRANVHHEAFDFSELVDGETLQFESVAFERGCEFEESIAQGVTVNGDEQRLRKMTSTLIENALKYVDANGTVKIELTTSGSTAVLAISNTGSTISPDDLPHIFDRFYRTDKARTSGEGGFGLGLAIAREIAREHDGDITCASNEAGTTFTVTLPVA